VHQRTREEFFGSIPARKTLAATRKLLPQQLDLRLCMFCGAPLQGLAKLRLHVLFRAAFTGSRDCALSRRQLLVALEWSPMHVFLKSNGRKFP
jgi:hypothetical protein